MVHVADDAGAAVRDRVERRGEMHANAHRGRVGEWESDGCQRAQERKKPTADLKPDLALRSAPQNGG